MSTASAWHSLAPTVIRCKSSTSILSQGAMELRQTPHHRRGPPLNCISARVCLPRRHFQGHRCDILAVQKHPALVRRRVRHIPDRSGPNLRNEYCRCFLHSKFSGADVCVGASPNDRIHLLKRLSFSVCIQALLAGLIFFDAIAACPLYSRDCSKLSRLPNRSAIYALKRRVQ
jgi:hypothetical protein